MSGHWHETFHCGTYLVFAGSRAISQRFGPLIAARMASGSRRGLLSTDEIEYMDHQLKKTIIQHAREGVSSCDILNFHTEYRDWGRGRPICGPVRSLLQCSGGPSYGSVASWTCALRLPNSYMADDDLPIGPIVATGHKNCDEAINAVCLEALLRLMRGPSRVHPVSYTHLTLPTNREV